VAADFYLIITNRQSIDVVVDALKGSITTTRGGGGRFVLVFASS
jgi:hypothetical protein